jgi:hypothetical protein
MVVKKRVNGGEKRVNGGEKRVNYNTLFLFFQI